MKIFLPMNLSYDHELINTLSLPFRRRNISMIRCISLLTTELAFTLPVLTSAMLLTRRCPMVLWRSVFNLRNSLNYHFAKHHIILESYVKIDFYVYQDMIPLKNNKHSSRAKQPLSLVNLTGLTTTLTSKNIYLKIGFAQI